MSITSEDEHFMLECFEKLFKLERIGASVVRSYGPHMGGINKPTRLFGGQTAAQFHMAFRRLFPRSTVHTLRIGYLSPGNLTDPIDFAFRRVAGTNFVVGTAVQSKRIIVSANLRIGPADDLLDQSPYFMPQLGNPISYRSLGEKLQFTPDGDPAREAPLRLTRKSSLFEFRPVDYGQMSFQGNWLKPLLTWCRLSSLYRESKGKKDGLAVVVMLSDCILFHSARVLFEEFGRSREYGGVASLNHSVWFHSSEGIDPRGWFLYEVRCTKISNTSAMIEGRMFDEFGKCLVTVVQEGYIASKI